MASGNVKEALKIAKEQEIASYFELGHAHRMDNQFDMAIGHYKKALIIAKERGNKEHEIEAYLQLGHVYKLNGDFETAIGHCKKALEISREQGNKEQETEAYLKLGHAFCRLTNKFEKAIGYCKKGLEIAKEHENEEQETEAYLRLGHVYRLNDESEKAIDSCNNALEIKQKSKKQETQAYLELGHTYCKWNNQFDKAIYYYEKALKIAIKRNNKKQEKKAYLMLGKAYCRLNQVKRAKANYGNALKVAKGQGNRKQYYHANKEIANLLSRTGRCDEANEYYKDALEIAKELGDKQCCSKDCDYEIAVGWYEEALDMFKSAGVKDLLMQENIITGLAIAWFKLGDTKQSIGLLQEARKLNSNKPDTENTAMIHDQESKPTADDWIDYVIKAVCNPSNRTNGLPNEDLVRLEEYIKTFPASYVYTQQRSSKEDLTEKVRKNMITNVKQSAYQTLLSQNNDGSAGRNDGKFVGDQDQQIFNLATDDIRKNSSTKKPAVLLESLAKCIQSIGQISCGRVRGTCFLVAHMLVITNHHVYMMINTERNERRPLDSPIKVSFGYFRKGQTEHILTVQVDEEQDPQLENSKLDYKFLRLKQHDGLNKCARLGPIVRNRTLQEGRVIIIGHPMGEELCEETCVVVSNDLWSDKLNKRHANRRAGVHMTNEELLQSNENFKDCLPYDTSLFSGASGSPVFDLKGNIVAMHTQGYTLDVDGGKCSLMEFGVQFYAIWEDIKAKESSISAEELFPHYTLADDEQPMDQG